MAHSELPQETLLTVKDEAGRSHTLSVPKACLGYELRTSSPTGPAELILYMRDGSRAVRPLEEWNPEASAPEELTQDRS